MKEARTEKNPMNKDKALELDPIWLFEFSVIEIDFTRISRTQNHHLSCSGFFHLIICIVYTVPFFFCASPVFMLLSHARYASLDT